MPTPTQSLSSMEDNLVDLRAIARLGLLALEDAEAADLPNIRGEITTALYLIVEKIDSAQRHIKAMYLQERTIQ